MLAAIFIFSFVLFDQAQAVDTGWSSEDLNDEFNLPNAGGDGDVSNVILGIMDWLLTIVGVVAIIAFVISGIQYFLVATDEKMLESAKKTMQAAIIGIIVAISGFIVIQAVNSILEADGFTIF